MLGGILLGQQAFADGALNGGAKIMLATRQTLTISKITESGFQGATHIFCHYLHTFLGKSDVKYQNKLSYVNKINGL